MNSSSLFEIDLRELCSDVILAKACALYQEGAVSRLCRDDSQLSARVRGSGGRHYHVQIDLAGMGWSCSCPAAEYQPLCKHVAAVVMQTSGDEPAADKGNEAGLIAELLGKKSSEQLVELCLELLAENPGQWEKWLIQAQLAKQPPDLRQLKKMINSALPLCSLWEWDEVRDYFVSAEGQFELIWMAQDQQPLETQFQLTEYALKRLNKVVARLDDSGGFRFAIEANLSQKLPKLFAQLSWSTSKKANWLLAYLKKPLDLFPAVPEAFSLDDETRRVLCQGSEKALQSALDHHRKSERDYERSWRLERLAEPLLQAAEQQGKWRELERIKALLASRYDDYLRLSELCLIHQEPQDAERWLTQSFKVAKEEYEQSACLHHQVKVLVALNEQTKAWQLAWLLFAQRPGFEAYQKLARLHRQLGQPQADFMEQVEALLAPVGTSLLAFYLEQQQWDKARVWVANNEAFPEQLLELADRIITMYPDEALALHLRVIGKLIEQTNNQAYQQALTQLQRLQQQWLAHQQPAECFDVAVTQLAERYKQKRNMCALLRKHFGI